MALNSIRAGLLISLATVSILVMALSMFDAFQRRDADLQRMRDSLRLRANLIAEMQTNAIRRAERFLEFTASSGVMSDLAEDPRCAEKMKLYTHGDEYLANAFIANEKGEVICNPRPGNATVNLLDRSYFQEALRASKPVLGDPVYGRFTEKFVLPIARRIEKTPGKGQYVAVASHDLDWVNKRAFTQLESESKGLRIGLITSNGLILARQPDPGKWVGKNIHEFPAFAALKAVQGDGVADVVSHDGEARIYAYAPFTRTGNETVFVWISLPRALVTAQADRQYALRAAVIVSLTLLVFSVIWFAGYRGLVRPIEAVGRAARRLARGEYGVRTGLAHSSDEIGQLAMAFDDMASQLDRFDSLTGLLNLHSFGAALGDLLREQEKIGGRLSLVRLQIRDLHQIDANFGFAAGIEMVKLVAQRLRQAVGPTGVLARLGEGSFAIALPGVGDALGVTRFVERVSAELAANPPMFRGVFLEIDAAFAAAMFPDDGQTAEDLLLRSGVAMAQPEAHARVKFYEHVMNERLMQRMHRLSAMRQALREEAFELHYQPQVDLKTGRLLGFEALVRWSHPEEGQIPPMEFIELAEETGLIIPLGDWIARRACSQLAQWRQSHPALSHLVMAINVSAMQLISSEFLPMLERTLAETGLPANRLELEITESQLMEFSKDPQMRIRQLKDIGVMVSIDDFGTGYSSLSYLKHLAVERLKIDKSFIHGLAPGSGDTAIVEATIAMAHKLGMAVIAEGVETNEQMAFLRNMSCDQIQGYFISRPMPADRAEIFAIGASPAMA